MSGHGTFIAGLVHQACPDAEIVSWRIVPSAGPIVESDWVAALQPDRRAGPAVPRRRSGRPARSTCSACRWATTTRRPRTCSSTRRSTTSSRTSRRSGTLVVCSAGNDATSAPELPGGVRAVVGRQRAGPARPRLPADRLGRRAQPEPRDRRAVQQRRAVGARVRAGRRGDEHDSRHVPGRPRSRWRGPRRSAGCARPSTPTTSAAASGCGAARRSRLRSWPGTSLARWSSSMERARCRRRPGHRDRPRHGMPWRSAPGDPAMMSRVLDRRGAPPRGVAAINHGRVTRGPAAAASGPASAPTDADLLARHRGQPGVRRRRDRRPRRRPARCAARPWRGRARGRQTRGRAALASWPALHAARGRRPRRWRRSPRRSRCSASSRHERARCTSTAATCTSSGTLPDGRSTTSRGAARLRRGRATTSAQAKAEHNLGYARCSRETWSARCATMGARVPGRSAPMSPVHARDVPTRTGPRCSWRPASSTRGRRRSAGAPAPTARRRLRQRQGEAELALARGSRDATTRRRRAGGRGGRATLFRRGGARRAGGPGPRPWCSRPTSSSAGRRRRWSDARRPLADELRAAGAAAGTRDDHAAAHAPASCSGAARSTTRRVGLRRIRGGPAAPLAVRLLDRDVRAELAAARAGARRAAARPRPASPTCTRGRARSGPRPADQRGRARRPAGGARAGAGGASPGRPRCCSSGRSGRGCWPVRVQPVRAPQDEQMAADLAELREMRGPRARATRARGRAAAAGPGAGVAAPGSGEVADPVALAELQDGAGRRHRAGGLRRDRASAWSRWWSPTAGTTRLDLGERAPLDDAAGRAAARPRHGGVGPARRAGRRRCAARWRDRLDAWPRCWSIRCSTRSATAGVVLTPSGRAGRCPVDAAARAASAGRSRSPSRATSWLARSADAAAHRRRPGFVAGPRVARAEDEVLAAAQGVAPARGPDRRRRHGGRRVRARRPGRRPARRRPRPALGREPAVLRPRARRRAVVRLRHRPAPRRTRRRPAVGVRGRPLDGALGRGADRHDHRLAARRRPLRGRSARRPSTTRRRTTSWSGCTKQLAAGRRPRGRTGRGGVRRSRPTPPPVPLLCFG